MRKQNMMCFIRRRLLLFEVNHILLFKWSDPDEGDDKRKGDISTHVACCQALLRELVLQALTRTCQMPIFY